MKISGSSKINIDQTALKEQPVQANPVSEKEMRENLILQAEASDLIHNEDVIEQNQTKLQKVKKLANDMLAKTKPFRERQILIASEAVTKARALSPYIDKTITAIDIAVNYITKPYQEGRNDVVQDTRSPAIFGVWVMIVTFGVGMLWATFAPLDSASHAIGKIILESKKRIIQHPFGGVVKEIFVRDGDHVTKGQVLVTLDDTELKARKNQFHYKYLSVLAEVARLTAERDGLTQIKFPEEILNHASDPKVQELIYNQEKYFTARESTISSKISITEKTIAQFMERKNALLPQIEAVNKLVKITSDQVESYKKLFAKGNLNKNYLQDAETRNAEAEGRKGHLISALAEAEHAILHAQLELENLKHQISQDTIDRLKQGQAELSVVNEQLKENEEHLKRTVITAPEEGNISNLNDHLTPHGVLGPQQVLMEVIPQDDNLVVEAKIPAIDIASVKIGQVSRVRLTAYRARVVPVLEGKVISVSADATMPDQIDLQLGTARQPYYKARIEIDKKNLEEVAALKNVSLYPGMGVDVMIVTGTRTLMNYIMDPITLTLDHAFKEK